MPRKAYAYILVMAAAGLVLMASAFVNWQSANPARFLGYFLIAALASALKIRLPGMYGTMSVNFLFILVSAVELSLAETMAVACTGAMLQSFWKSRRRGKSLTALFNVSTMALAATASYSIYHHPAWPTVGFAFPIRITAFACTYFVFNTFPIAVIICLTEGKRLARVWKEGYFWSFPYYLLGAAMAAQLSIVNRTTGWQASVLILPVVYWIYRSYRSYLDRLEKEKKHVEDMAGLHFRTIEALALAIEAKDHTTHDHLRRVQVYAVELGRQMNLSESDLEALRAAAVLHDIGKLAVPEHIISKPGKLTPEEFEKMKIHPVVGAEILERVKFPYAVAPIVAAHHEKWNGAGYPKGLKGEEIPIGARILSAVDCLDALASDRQYRRALPLEQAMDIVAGESGKAYDPKVVELLQRRCVELEQMARNAPVEEIKLSTDIKVERGDAPATGFANAEPSAAAAADSPGAVRSELQALFDATQQLGNFLSLEDLLALFAARIQKAIPYNALAVYTLAEGTLTPAYVGGEDFRLFSSLTIPAGQGLSGWVAEHRKIIVNGNPAVEPGYLNDGAQAGSLRSALCVPLEASNRIVGVLTLYHSAKDAYSPTHLKVLQDISGKLAQTIPLQARRKHENKQIPTATSLMQMTAISPPGPEARNPGRFHPPA